MEHKLRIVNQELTAFNVDDSESPMRATGFGPIFGNNQSVEVVYCSDRSGTIWAGDKKDACGFMAKHAFKRGGDAYGLVYLHAEAASPKTGNPNRIQSITPVVEDLRVRVVKCLVHELTHVRHAWLMEDTFDKDYQQAGPYKENLYEKAAYSVADRFIAQKRGSILNGEFDKYLPDWITKKPK